MVWGSVSIGEDFILGSEWQQTILKKAHSDGLPKSGVSQVSD